MSVLPVIYEIIIIKLRSLFCMLPHTARIGWNLQNKARITTSSTLEFPFPFYVLKLLCINVGEFNSFRLVTYITTTIFVENDSFITTRRTAAHTYVYIWVQNYPVLLSFLNPHLRYSPNIIIPPKPFLLTTPKRIDL